MVEPKIDQGCPNCARLLQQLEQMEMRVGVLEDRLIETETKLAQTQVELAKTKAELAQARKNSGNSSKPPSSDLVKPSASKDGAKDGSQKKTGKKRKRGGQPGHPKHERPAFDEADIDHFWDYVWPACPECGGDVLPSDEPPRMIQQVELVTVPLIISEHRGQAWPDRGCCRWTS